jgi:1-acyl-sn-glycerol-3-phosphate acyltransferase
MRDPIPPGEWGFSRNPFLWIVFFLRALVSLAVTLVLLVPLFLGTERLSHTIAKFWARLLLCIYGYRIRKTGTYVPQPCVLVSNHLAYMDIMLLLAVVPGQFRFIADEFLFAVPLLAQVMKKCGYLPVRRSAQHLRRMLDAAADHLRRGIPVLVFPEGGVNRSGVRERLVRVEPGFIKIAAAAAVPVQPLTVRGTAEAQQRFDRLVQHVALCWAGGTESPEWLAGLSREALLERMATANEIRYTAAGEHLALR